MGRRGPKPKTAEARELDDASHRPAKTPGSIRYLERVPDPPARLGRYGRELWIQSCETLVDRQMLSVSDLTGLQIYCHAFDEWCEADDDIRKNGYAAVSGESGYEYQRPSVKRRSEAAKTLREWSSRFGLTPLDRAGVELPIRNETPPSSDPLADSLPSKPKAPPAPPPAKKKSSRGRT